MGNCEKVHNYCIIQAIEMYTTMPKEQVCSMAALETGSELLLGFRQGCLLSLTFFNIILERIMSDALEHHKVVTALGIGTSSISASQMTLMLMLKRKKQLVVLLPV